MKIIHVPAGNLGHFMNDFRQNSISKMWDEMDKHFKEVLDFDYPISGKIMGSGFPRTDIIFNDEENIVTYVSDIQGWSKENVKIEIEEDHLILSGTQNESRKREGSYLLKERKTTSFRRTFPLPLDIEPTDIDAEFIDGELIITIPIKELIEDEPKILEVKIK